MPTWLLVLILGTLLILGLAVLAPTSVNDWFNSHRWVLPAFSFLAVIVIALLVGGFSTALRDDQVGSCERRNPEVVGEVENLEHDRALYRKLRGGARSHGEEGKVAAFTIAIEQKSEAIGSKVAARARYSEHPGARATRSVIVDCEAQYHTG